MSLLKSLYTLGAVTAEQTGITEIKVVTLRRSSNPKTGLRSFINIGSKTYNFSTLALSCLSVVIIVDLLSFKNEGLALNPHQTPPLNT